LIEQMDVQFNQRQVTALETIPVHIFSVVSTYIEVEAPTLYRNVDRGEPTKAVDLEASAQSITSVFPRCLYLPRWCGQPK